MSQRTSLPIARDEDAHANASLEIDRPLVELLRQRTIEGTLVEPGPTPEHLRCTACAHRCVINEGRAGACGVRFVRDAHLRVPHGYVARRYVRPVETNTIFHVRPGARSLTFGMFGCDLRCPYCHNWRVSQVVREERNDEHPIDVTPRELVDHALHEGCEVLCAAYNEPMIASEWTHAIFTEAKSRGLLTALISDGNTTPEALAYMRPVTDVYRVDLKGYTNEQYKLLGGRLTPVLEAITEAKRLGYWVEVVTLVVPDFNDGARGLRDIATHLATLDPNIPWHLNAFVPRYRLDQHPQTPAMTLIAAAGAAYAKGLRFVYVSNLPDEVQQLGHTRCPECQAVLVERVDYRTRVIRLEHGSCPDCHTPIPGIWSDAKKPVFDAPMLSDGEMP